MALIARELRVLSHQWPWVFERFCRRHLSRLRERRFLTDDRMAKLAIAAQHFAFPAHVISLVTAKATRIERMADIIGMGAPIDFHLRKNIGLVNLLHLSNGFSNRLALGLINLGRLLQIKAVEPRCDTFPSSFLAGKILTQYAHGFSLDVGQVRVNESAEKSHVDGAVRIAKDMARPVMAIDAIHAPYLELFQLLSC